MSISKKIMCFCSIVMILALSIVQEPVYAASKQAELITTTEQENLTVLFTFDQEVVDITFISPSGEKKTTADADVEYATGELWSTYRIVDAEIGRWSVEYDLGSNTEIEYSIIEDDYGIWIQYLNVVKISDDKVELSFEADFESDTIFYHYEIFAISETDPTIVNQVADGHAPSNEETSVELDLSGLSSDDYVFRLDVSYRDGSAEIFDSVVSQTYHYVNSNTPVSIDDYKVKIDKDDLTCTVDWTDYRNWGYNAYKLIVNADGETIYTAEFESDITENGVLFPLEAKSLEIRLAYQQNNIWSSYKTKTIHLDDEILSNPAGEISKSSQLEIAYKVKQERTLHVNLNGEEGTYRLTEEGTLAFHLMEGSNTLYAEMESDNLVFYVIDTEVYCDVNPPTLTIYDDLDGKTFYSDSITVIGKMSGGDVLKIDGETVTTGEDGVFSREVSLSLGENTVTIEAEDSNGNVTARVLTLYRNSHVLKNGDSTEGWKQFLPLLAAFLASVLIIILSAIFMKKTKKTKGNKKVRVAPFIIWDILVCLLEAVCIWRLVQWYQFNHSLSFVELAEKSAAEAARYLKIEDMFQKISLAGILLLIISIALTVLVIVLSKKREKKRQENAVLFCGECGTRLEEGCRFCPNCGAAVEQ